MSRFSRITCLTLILACCALIGWGIHVCSYDLRRGLVVTSVAVLSAAANFFALTSNIPRIGGRLRVAGVLVAAAALAVVLGIWWNLSPARTEQSQRDPLLYAQLTMARRSLPALAASVVVFGLTLMSLPGRRPARGQHASPIMDR